MPSDALCMLICIFHTCMVIRMTDLIPDGAGINEEDIARSAPLVRALAVQRLEMIWRACEPHINLTQDDRDLGYKPDPRFIEAGIRVVDRLSSLYGLLKPVASADQGVDQGRAELQEAAAAAIMALEQKLQGGG